MTSSDSGLRRILLLITGLGALGLAAELLLLGHYEEWTQWLPLVVLALALASAAVLALRATPATVQAFRIVMCSVLVTGVVGLGLHYTGNREFERELDGDLAGWALVRESLRGATPALAPGAMIQLALLGLALTWRHPALTTRHEPTGGMS